MAAVQRVYWVQSLPWRLANRQVKRESLRCRPLSCGNGEAGDDSNNDSKNALKRLDSYFNRLQAVQQTELETLQAGSEADAKQEQPSPSGSSEESKEKTTEPSLKYLQDEYALKEELLATVLKEFDAAEYKALAKELSEATRGDSKSTFTDIKDGKPSVVLRSFSGNKTKDGAEARKEVPLILLRPGSLIVSTLVSINAGVYIFGLASSQQTENGVDLAFLHGAKVNELILAGEWWRLITPMFLHSGLLHISLSCWAMISFGTQAEGLYGSTGLVLIYLLGGLFGNLASFFETPQTTVGGTGPVFAIICSWIVFLVKNRDTVRAFDTGDLLQKVLVFSALSVLLGNELPVDAWSHVGGALVGILFGAVASPLYKAVDAKEISSEKNDLSLEKLALAFLLCSGVLLLLYLQGQNPDLFSPDLY